MEVVVKAVLIGRRLIVIAAVRVALPVSRTGLPGGVWDLVIRAGLACE
jgi:hypothetical protein